MSAHVQPLSTPVALVPALLAGALTGLVAINSPYLAAVLVAAGPVFLWGVQTPTRILALFIVLAPFSGTSALGDAVLQIPGAKPLNVLALLMGLALLLNARPETRLSRPVAAFATLYLAVFTVAVIRSIGHYDLVRSSVETPLQYMLSYYIKPCVYFFPFLVVAKTCRTARDVVSIGEVITLSTALLAAYAVGMTLTQVGPGIADRLSWHYREVLSLHRNDLANFFLIASPVVLARFFVRKTFSSLACLALVVVGTLFVFSRTAYLLLPLSIVAYLALSRRLKSVPIVVGAMLALAVLFSSVIQERATTGFEAGDANAIFAGRIEGLWLPLVEELAGRPTSALVGNGRYSIVFSEAAERARILEVGHPHNMYLEAILDVGIVGFVPILAFLVVLMKRLLATGRHDADREVREYAIALFVSLAAYLFAGLTGRSVFPMLSNSYLWVALGMAVALIGVESRRIDDERDFVDSGENANARGAVDGTA